MNDDVLCYQNWYYIPPELLRREMLKQHHDDPFAGHFGFAQILKLLEQKFYSSANWEKFNPSNVT